MIQIPTNLIAKYTTFIGQRGVKIGYHGYYGKWLRYYLEFCHKYKFNQTGKESLPAFTQKLEKKSRLIISGNSLTMRSPFSMKWSGIPAEESKRTFPVSMTPKFNTLQLNFHLLILKENHLIK